MKSLAVFSDTHHHSLPEAFYEVMESVDYVIFCGDGLSSLMPFAELYKDKFVYVKGNCDFSTKGPDKVILQIEDVKVLVTHGHLYGVKSNTLNLKFAAEEQGADLVLFGHTHANGVEKDGSVTYINAGSLGEGYLYGDGYYYVVINGKNILAKFVKVY